MGPKGINRARRRGGSAALSGDARSKLRDFSELTISSSAANAIPSSAEQSIHLRLAVIPAAICVLLSSCVAPDRTHHIVVSARDQKLALLERGAVLAVYPVSTSKFGLGDSGGTYRTPLGELEV